MQSAAPATSPGLAKDDLGRSFASLRLSLTARCNFACLYCVPDSKRLLPADAEMQAQDFARALSLLMRRGIGKLRITGGEPLLSKELEPFLRQIADFPLTDKALTTNGSLLAERLPVLLHGGIRRINVSLDSLDAKRFARLSRGGDIRKTLSGMELAVRAGLAVRINCVPMRGQNDDEIVPMLEYCTANNMEIRFIELMQMGHLHASQTWRQQVVGRDEILQTIAGHYAIEPLTAPADSTAERWRVEQLDGCFGIIANNSAPFCGGCDRLRLTSDGYLYGCISSDKRHSIRDLLALPDERALAELDRLLPQALRAKSRSHFDGEVTVMKFLGG